MIGPIRRLDLEELPHCLALARSRGWLPEERRWRLLFDIGTVYGLHDEADDLAGTTVLARYGTTLAAISMVLVAARHSGGGLGRRLMTHALAEAGAATVFLNATEQGRPLYEKLGFVTTGTTYTRVGRFAPTGAPALSRPAQPHDLPALRALDTQVNGADRTCLIERLPGLTEQLRVVERDGAVTGYGGTWRTVSNILIGPIIADTVDDAKTLIADLASASDGPVRIDLDDRHPQLREWASKRGIQLQKTSPVMIHDGRTLPGDRARYFTPVMQALG